MIDGQEETFTLTELLIRDLDDETTQQLRALADRHGRSMEAEVRAIIERALSGELSPRPKKKKLGTAMREIFAPLGGVELPDVRRHPSLPHKPISFEE
jgi:plasmid stability protein